MVSSKLFVFAVRLICAAYVSMLTALLLLPDPRTFVSWLLRFDVFSAGPAAAGTHFVFFAILAALVLLSRLPWNPAAIAGLLIAYAIGLELLQSYFPPRTVELRDFVENLLGLAAGTAVWRLMRKPPAPSPKEDG